MPVVGATVRKGTGSRTPVAYLNPVMSIAARAANGARNVVGTMAAIVTDAVRAGKGTRQPVAYIKPIAANAQRMGRGARAVISHLSSVAVLALRAGRGSREPVSYVSPISTTAGRAIAKVTRRIAAFINPILGKIGLPQVNARVTYLERQVKVEVEE
jgi:hypothetical protein